MTTPLRSVPSLLLIALVALVVLTVLPAAGAAVTTAKPGPGPLSPAFVEALHDPLVTIGLGRLPSPVEVHVGAAAEARAARMAEPSYYSLIDEGRLTPVKDQGSESTCWAFANIAALESSLMRADPAPDFSEDNLIGRDGYGPFPYPYDTYSYGGYDFMAVAYFARWAGPLLETDDPYPTRSHPAIGPVQDHVQGVVMIPGRATATDNDLIKRLVRDNGALSVGMYWDNLAFSEVTDAAGYHATYFLDRRWGENHGVTIVGWDDAYPAGRFQGDDGAPPADGAFLVRNTWGSDWGEDGSFWVSYYDKSFARDQGLGGYGGATSYAVVEDTANYTRAYQYDKLGVTDHWGFNSTRVWGANRFTVKATQSIAAAGFYALSSSTRYEVWAGRTLRSLGLRATGTVELPGYTTVPFSTELRVSAGKRFVVAVKLVSPGATHPMAVERPARPWMSGATARAGQSYLSWNGTRWIDATSVRTGSNVCIKAFAE
jgi:C1A family cysteine protease